MGFFTKKATGSVFAKIGTADTKLAEAKGRISAIDSANADKHKQAADLEKESSRVHGESDSVNDRLDNLPLTL